jgi:hypothetical protein
LRAEIPRSFAWPPTADRLALCKTPPCYSGDGWAALDFWPDDEVKHPNPVKINFVIFDLNDRSRRAEIPLLLDQGTQRVSLIRRPLEGELLRTLCVGLYETEPDPSDPSRLIKDKLDCLLADLDSAPTMPIFLKCGFDWIPRIFGCRFNSGQGLDINPAWFSFLPALDQNSPLCFSSVYSSWKHAILGSLLIQKSGRDQ